MEAPPCSKIENVTEVFHGVPVTDPYRWLEVQDSPSTREWIGAQTRYARSYLDSIPGREQIHRRIRELLDVETYDSVLKIGNRYFFRKRLPGQEQPCICVRNGWDGQDDVLIDPTTHSGSPYTAIKLLQVSRDGCFLLYEIKDGGERSGRFAIFDVQN
jgi:prolyl oligopeptidase